MSSRSHLWVRLGALALLAAAAVWPKPTRPDGARSQELVRAVRTVATTSPASRAPARVAPKRPMKLVVADADDAQLTN